MALNIPEDATVVVQRAKTDVQRALPEINPFQPNSWADAFITAYGYRVFETYQQIVELQRQVFWDTSTGEQLERQASWFGIIRNPATKSVGDIVVTGTAGSVVPVLTDYQNTDGETYSTTQAITISDNSLSVTSLTRVGFTATAVFSAAHNLTSAVSVTISGADQLEYNGTFQITVTSATTFDYQILALPATPATGTISAAFTTGFGSVESAAFGELTVLDAETPLTIASPVIGIDDEARVGQAGVSGGSDTEEDEPFRERFLERVQNPVAHFNPADITERAKRVSGVTRVFVNPVTPAIGQVTIYFTRDDDEDGPIPDGAEINRVKNEISLIVPANTSLDDVFVLAPVGVVVDFTFTNITPDTNTMRDSVISSLQAFFAESTTVGVDIDRDSYRSAIFNTFDIATGQSIQSFTLSTPIADITINPGELGILGTVSFV